MKKNLINPSEEHKLFGDTILDLISPEIEKFGFETHRIKIEKYFTEIVFRKDKQYIKVSGTTYLTDYPYHYNIVLGEGYSDNFLESDWNSIALWRLKSLTDPETNTNEFAFPFGDEVRFSIANACREIIQYAEPFLQGDLTLFLKARSEHNRIREPYKIYKRDANGNYTTSYEPNSVALKKKYS
ncbi:hypothetical protein OGH69_15165 [Flavobacterium sp. MFBS3-15]|uniref:hypothetical protein n=1 Tax=Flavobacterium sp. MFBS3-15 TaxID=2989816 RepID=UPI002236517F|nr:hypothetical protein [Flavobacterium sp. MFBS3-15]MCW4470314.1 hypothetical protein [Flavobacterium sp. MFBS3-15]